MRESAREPGQEVSIINKYEDTFDVFINFIVRRSPTVYVLINMTLMIWLVQTIYSSRLDSIPRSIYFFSPYFSAPPIINLYTSKSLTCRQGFQKLSIKTFPAVKQQYIKKTNLSNWDADPIVFCAQKGQKSPNFSQQCQQTQTYCSGFCVNDTLQCPITSIKKIHIQQYKLPPGYEQFYITSDRLYKYILSRQSKSTYVVDLQAQYQFRCSDDYKYFDKYDTFRQYWNSTLGCGSQGSLPADVYKNFDQMSVKQFFENNYIQPKDLSKIVRETQIFLGTINLITFNNQTSECRNSNQLSNQLKNYLVKDPIKPTFTKSMLIIAFIFFTLSWAWLIGYYCFGGSSLAKNRIIILMLTIQLIVVSFLFSQNIDMFHTQQVIMQIANCLQTQIQASTLWQFGITNSSPFKGIMYICTTFLLLQIIAQFIDRYMYESYYPGEPGYNDDRNRCFWS